MNLFTQVAERPILKQVILEEFLPLEREGLFPLRLQTVAVEALSGTDPLRSTVQSTKDYRVAVFGHPVCCPRMLPAMHASIHQSNRLI